MLRFFVASQRFEAYLLLDRLTHAGIKAHVFNEHMSSIVGDVPPEVALPQVWLDDDAVELQHVADDVGLQAIVDAAEEEHGGSIDAGQRAACQRAARGASTAGEAARSAATNRRRTAASGAARAGSHG